MFPIFVILHGVLILNASKFIKLAFELGIKHPRYIPWDDF